MRAVSLVMPGEALLDVAGQSDVVTRRGLQRLEHVDESLRHHRARGRKFMATGNALDFRACHAGGRQHAALFASAGTLTDCGIWEVRRRRAAGTRDILRMGLPSR